LSEAAGTPDQDALRRRLGDALYWGGDSVLARDALRALQIAASQARTPEERREQLRNRCAIAEWRLTHGNLEDAEATIAQLERTATTDTAGNRGFARFAEMCAATLDALRVGTSANPFALAKLDRLDSLARTNIFEVCCGDAVLGANLVVARLAEYQGDLPRALRAVRRRTSGFELAPIYMSTFFAEEGRLAALVGDTAEAIQAYRQYLALRSHAEPEVAPAVQQVRADLERLLAEGPRRN
jgi:hypothetical protein